MDIRPFISKDKAKVTKAALKHGRKVLWLDGKGIWHAAVDRQNTPLDAIETEDVDETKLWGGDGPEAHVRLWK
jgi:hypothetical protein